MTDSPADADQYRLDQNVGYLLRRCFQLSTAEFARAAPADLSPPRFAVLARLCELGPVSQNRLGRLVSADAATVKGIVDRLRALELVTVDADPADRRQRLVAVTAEGRALHRQGVEASLASASALFKGLSTDEAYALVQLLSKAAEGADPSRRRS